MLIDRIGAMVRSKYVPKIYTSLVMYSSLGMFFVKYSRVWPMINNIFPILAKNDWDMFWTIIHRQLLKIRSKITMTKKVGVLAVVDENEDEGEESADKEMACRLLNDTIRSFRGHGINEWVGPFWPSSYIGAPGYVASATNTYFASEHLRCWEEV